MSGELATVLCVWESFTDVMTRRGGGLGFAPMNIDFDEMDKAAEDSARERPDEGAQRAQRARLNAQPRTRVRDATIALTILAEANDVGARAIVVGTRGLSGVKSLLLGSVCHAVLQHADRPVIVIPSPEVAHERAAHLQ